MEAFGRRLAKCRAELGWTQARLAERIAVSRVALSHIEAGMSVANERTVVLLAGVFGVEPYELVAGTDYPTAKAERLPVGIARHTEADLQLALLAAEIDRLEEIRPLLGDRAGVNHELRRLHHWRTELAGTLAGVLDEDDRRRLAAARHGLRRRIDELERPGSRAAGAGTDG